MTFSQYFKTSSYCLIASGFAAIATTGALGWVSILLFSTILIGSWFVDTFRFRKMVPTWILIGLALAYLPVLVIDYELLSRSFMAAALHLLLFTASVKLLTLSKDRDFVLLYLISFAELIAASTLTVNIAFIICFLIFLFSGISALILFEMRRSNTRVQGEVRIKPLVVPKELRGTGLELFAPFPVGPFIASAAGITLFIISCALPLFFLLPRVTQGLYRQPSGNTKIISGFSERVVLGQIGAVKLSDAVVMRVKTDKPPSRLPPDLKWRGLSFDFYDGRSWKRSRQTRYAIPEQGWYYKLQESAQGTDWINQTFFLEAMSTDIVFAMPKALAVSKDVGHLQRDSAENLYTTKHPHRKLRYSAISDPVRPDPSVISDWRPKLPDTPDIYLQIPALDSRIEELAKRITKTQNRKFDKARALQQYLRSNYGYSLALRGTPNNKDPLAMFLFDIKEGHCEYFATAMTIMLRQIGIPARLVNGFRSGEYNSIGDNWIVRQYNAHSWVEAYFPPYGWIEFDPTPSDPPHPKTAVMQLISDLTDAIDLWWWDGVINYDSSRQYRVLAALRGKADDVGHTVKHFLTLVFEVGRAAAARLRSPAEVFSLVEKWEFWMPWIAAGILLMFRPVRRRLLGLTKRLLYRGNSCAVATSFYREAVELLGSRGIRRRREQTPLEFAHSLAHHPAGMPLLSLTQMYNAVRFGPPQPSLSRSEAETLLRSLRQSLRNSCHSPVASGQ
jgi:hypothetical protein